MSVLPAADGGQHNPSLESWTDVPALLHFLYTVHSAYTEVSGGSMVEKM